MTIGLGLFDVVSLLFSQQTLHSSTNSILSQHCFQKIWLRFKISTASQSSFKVTKRRNSKQQKSCPAFFKKGIWNLKTWRNPGLFGVESIFRKWQSNWEEDLWNKSSILEEKMEGTFTNFGLQNISSNNNHSQIIPSLYSNSLLWSRKHHSQ